MEVVLTQFHPCLLLSTQHKPKSTGIKADLCVLGGMHRCLVVCLVASRTQIQRSCCLYRRLSLHRLPAVCCCKPNKCASHLTVVHWNSPCSVHTPHCPLHVSVQRLTQLTALQEQHLPQVSFNDPSAAGKPHCLLTGLFRRKVLLEPVLEVCSQQVIKDVTRHS